VIIAGRGCLSAWKELRAYAEKRGATVVCSMGGIGAVHSDCWHYLGMLGHTGDRLANQAVAAAKTIIALGTRLDMRQTGTAPDLWADKYIIMVNEDCRELEHARVPVSEKWLMSVERWLRVQDA